MADALYNPFGMPTRMSAVLAATNFALNASTDQAEWIFQAPEAITITRLGVRHGSTTGTSPTYKISLQGVDSSGNPDGTIKGGGTPASKTFSPTSLGWASNSFNWLTLDNAYTCARGDYLSLVVAYDSGTVDGSNNSSFTMTSAVATALAVPYSIQNDAGSRTRSNSQPLFGYSSASKVYGYPVSTSLNQTLTSTTEAGLKFTIPSGWFSTYKVLGCRFLGTIAAAKTLTATLYDGGGASDTTVLQQVTWDTDLNSTAAASRWSELYFDEATLSTLNAGSGYRLSLTVDSGTNTLAVLQVASADDWDAWQFGQQVLLSTRAGGSWTDDATKRPQMELILSEIAFSGGGSGGGANLLGGGTLVI